MGRSSIFGFIWVLVQFTAVQATADTVDSHNMSLNLGAIISYRPVSIKDDDKRLFYSIYYYDTYLTSRKIAGSSLDKRSFDEEMKTKTVTDTGYVLEPFGDVLVIPLHEWGKTIGVIIGPYPTTDKREDFVCIPFVRSDNLYLYDYLIRDDYYVLDIINSKPDLLRLSGRTSSDVLASTLFSGLLFIYASYEHDGYNEYFDYIPDIYFSGDCRDFVPYTSEYVDKARFQYIASLLPHYSINEGRYIKNKYMYLFYKPVDSLSLWYYDKNGLHGVVLFETRRVITP